MQSKNMESAKQILSACKKKDISITTISQNTFPLLARELDDLPIMLYYQGNIKANWSGEAVIGSRRCSKAGKERTVQLASKLTKRNITVISGMAKGIDSYAHTACIRAGGYTEASAKSGALITADYAKKYGRIVDYDSE